MSREAGAAQFSSFYDRITVTTGTHSAEGCANTAWGHKSALETEILCARLLWSPCAFVKSVCKTLEMPFAFGIFIPSFVGMKQRWGTGLQSSCAQVHKQSLLILCCLGLGGQELWGWSCSVCCSTHGLERDSDSLLKTGNGP